MGLWCDYLQRHCSVGQMNAIVAAAVAPLLCHVKYNAYKRDSDTGLLVNNLFNIAYHGEVRVVGKNGRFFSKLLVNPTWLQLAKVANLWIIRTGKHHRCYFESYRNVGPGQICLFMTE